MWVSSARHLAERQAGQNDFPLHRLSESTNSTQSSADPEGRLLIPHLRLWRTKSGRDGWEIRGIRLEAYNSAVCSRSRGIYWIGTLGSEWRDAGLQGMEELE